MIVLTPELARAAGADAANRRMREAGRKVWNRADYQTASREFRRLVDRETALQTLEASIAACRKGR